MCRKNGREIVNAEDHFNKEVIYDLENKVRVVPGNNTKRFKERWDSGNYRLVQFEESVRTPTGERAKYVFVAKSASKVGPLEKQQLAYNPGPHRQYADKFFAKQAVIENLDDGTQILHNPLTHTVGNEKQMTEWAGKMERARKAWNEAPDKANPPANLRKVVDDVYPGGWNKFDQAINEGKIAHDTPFEVVYDKAMPSYQTKLGAKSQVDWRDHDMSDWEQHALTHKQMYYSEKGDHLYGADGQLAETLDPMETMSLALNNVVYLKSYAAYNDKVVKEWARAAEGYLVDRHKSAWDAFTNGVLDERNMSSTQELRDLHQGLTAARNNMKTQMNLQTPGDMRLNNTRAKVANWVAGKFGDKGDKVARWMMKTDRGNPVNFLQRLTFNSAFFADVSQIVVQPMTAVAAVSIHPVHGLKSWAMAPWTLIGYFNKTPNFIDYVAKKAYSAGLIDDVADYKEMIKTLQKSGWLNIGREMAELGMFEHGFVRSQVGKAANEIERRGTALVRYAEGINRLTAFQIAWRDARKQFPDVKPDNPQFLRYLMIKADDLSFNMTRASQRAWQRGAWGLATRFQSYNASVIEQMLPAKIGGNPRWTPEQRARLVLGQFLLFGAAGIPGAHLLSEGIQSIYSSNTGKPMDRDLERAMTQGMLDTWLYGATGADVDFAARAGVGSAVKQLMQSVAGGTFEKSALELAAGPPGRTATSMLETISSMIEYFRYEQVENLGRDDFYLGLSELSKNFAAFSRYEAAYWAWKTGKLLDPKTHRPIVEVNDAEKVFIALGIQPHEVGDRFDMILDDDAKSKMAYTVAQEIVKIRRDALVAFDSDDFELQKMTNRQVATLMMPFRDDPKMSAEIARLASQLQGDVGTLYQEAIQRRYNKWGVPIPVDKDKQ